MSFNDYPLQNTPFNGGSITGQLTIAPTSTTTVPLTVNAPNGVSVHPLSIQINSGEVVYVDAAGTLHAAAGLTINNFSGAFVTGTITAQGQGGTNVPIIINSGTSQTGDTFEINSSSGSGGDLFKVTSSGAIVSTTKSTGDISLTINQAAGAVVDAVHINAGFGSVTIDRFGTIIGSSTILAQGVLQSPLNNVTPNTAPGNPSAGFYLYVDSADNKLKAKSSAGTITVLALP